MISCWLGGAWLGGHRRINMTAKTSPTSTATAHTAATGWFSIIPTIRLPTTLPKDIIDGLKRERVGCAEGGARRRTGFQRRPSVSGRQRRWVVSSRIEPQHAPHRDAGSIARGGLVHNPARIDVERAEESGGTSAPASRQPSVCAPASDSTPRGSACARPGRATGSLALLDRDRQRHRPATPPGGGSPDSDGSSSSVWDTAAIPARRPPDRAEVRAKVPDAATKAGRRAASGGCSHHFM